MKKNILHRRVRDHRILRSREAFDSIFFFQVSQSLANESPYEDIIDINELAQAQINASVTPGACQTAEE